jgi:Zn-dependent protease
VDQRTLIIVAVVVVLGIVVAASHRISSAQLIYFLVLVPSIIIHEISHGAVALAFGDSTAKRAGRLNLNPLRHIDPIGTLLVPAVLSLSGLGAYGWAKPVPVNPANLRSPRNHIVFVSLSWGSASWRPAGGPHSTRWCSSPS